MKNRFENKYHINSETGCWVWDGAKANGYGYFYIKGKVKRATHVALLVYKNTLVPIDKVVMHICDNPLCVNPDHLVIGTQKQNMRDCSYKRRTGAQQHPEKYKLGKPPVRIGELNGASKLTEQEVKEIRTRLSQGERQTVLASLYGVSQANVSLISRNLKWVV